MSIDRLPPQSIDAEQSVIGALLIDRDAVIEVADFLKPEDFYRQAHGTIYAAILDLYERREPVDIVVRGEIYMSKAEFAAINAERAKAGEELFKNPRNTAAGSIKQMDPREVAKRKLRGIFYGILPAPDTHMETLALIEALGLPASKHQRVTTWEGLCEIVEHWRDRRDDLPYEVDGLVIKIDSQDQRDRLGFGLVDGRTGGFAGLFEAQKQRFFVLDNGGKYGTGNFFSCCHDCPYRWYA